MRHVLFAAFALSAASAGTSACAMNPPANPAVRCSVSGGELLPADSGGAAALCAEVERELAAVAGDGISVEVRVISPYMAAASVSQAGGAPLPEVKVGIANRPLNRGAFAMLGRGIAAQLESRAP